ncbi:hypothetical protein ABIB51_002318 [Arthrobacter sp. UYCu712]
MWVDAIVWAIVAAWVMLMAVFTYFALSWGIDPGLPMLVMVMLMAGAALVLLMVVMRALLRQATIQPPNSIRCRKPLALPRKPGRPAPPPEHDHAQAPWPRN